MDVAVDVKADVDAMGSDEELDDGAEGGVDEHDDDDDEATSEFCSVDWFMMRLKDGDWSV